MNTLQEAALTALAFIRWNEFGECRTPGFQGPTPTAAEAADALEDALAQQELPQKERTDFMAGYDAGMADAKRMAQQGEPVCHGCGIPAGDVHMSTCKSGKWPSRVSNGNTTAPQAHPSRDVTELVEALETLARLGNGDRYGNSDGNMIAREALSKYKGAK